MAKNINLGKLFGVENLIQPKTLLTETREDVGRKTAAQAADDVIALIMGIDVAKNNQDIDGIIAHLNAIQLRVDVMQEVAAHIKKKYKK